MSNAGNDAAARSPSATERALDAVAAAAAAVGGDDEGRSWLEQVAIDKFGDAVRTRETRFADFRRAVNQARLEKTYDEYLSVVILYAILAGAVGAVLGLAAGTVLSYFNVFAGLSAPVGPAAIRGLFSPMMKNIAGVLLLMVVCTALFSPTVGAVVYFIPSFKADSRDREIQQLLPTTLTYMYALSDGGMRLIDIIDRLADEEETLGEVAREFQVVQNQMAFFGKDLKAALREARSTTPNDELGELFDDLVSMIDAGGDLTPFFQDKVDEYQRRNHRKQEAKIESLELIATGYVVLGVLFPLLLMVIITVFAAIGSVANDPLYAIIYIGIPMVSVVFLVVVDTMTADGTGTKRALPTPNEPPSPGEIRQRLAADPDPAMDGGTVDQHAAIADRRSGHGDALDAREQQLLGQLAATLRRDRIRATVGQPLRTIRRQPVYSLAFTLPAAVLYIIVTNFLGLVPYGPRAITTSPWYVTTVGFVVPLLVVLLPLSYFHERKHRYNRRAEQELPTVLGTLAATNATGATLIESFELVADSSHGPVADELEGVARELQWNVSINGALSRFTNRVRNRRVTRLFKLLIESSTASDRVTNVLRVTEADAKYTAELDAERLETMVVIMAIIMFTYLVFLGVTATLVVRLFPPFAEAAAASESRGALGAWTFDPGTYTMLFYHGILLQAVFAGAVAGKFGHDNAWVGLKFSIAGVLLAAVVFFFI